MAKSSKSEERVEIDPKRGDAILKKMLQTKPKQHSEMVKGRNQDAEKRAGVVRKKPSPK